MIYETKALKLGDIHHKLAFVRENAYMDNSHEANVKRLCIR